MRRVIDEHVLNHQQAAVIYLQAALAEFANAPRYGTAAADAWGHRIRAVCRAMQEHPEEDWSLTRWLTIIIVIQIISLGYSVAKSVKLQVVISFAVGLIELDTCYRKRDGRLAILPMSCGYNDQFFFPNNLNSTPVSARASFVSDQFIKTQFSSCTLMRATCYICGVVLE